MEWVVLLMFESTNDRDVYMPIIANIPLADVEIRSASTNTYRSINFQNIVFYM